MRLQDIEDKVETSGYELVVFATSSFPKELYDVRGYPFIRYAPCTIVRDGYSFSYGWYCTDYDYHNDAHEIEVLFTDIPTFMCTKKQKLLNSIKDFR